MTLTSELKVTDAVDAKVLVNTDTTMWVSCPPQHHGYLVGVIGKGLEIEMAYRSWETLTRNEKRHIRFWINKVFQLHSYDSNYEGEHVNFDECCTVGSWYENGVLYLDTCNWYADLETATKAAKQNAQLAFYDLKNREVVTV